MNHAERVLTLYWRLLQGEHVHKVNFSTEFQITERSFARDIQAIRYMLAEVHSPARLCFDKMADSYYLSDTQVSYIDGMDVMVLIKLLLGTRALRKDEMTHLVHVVGSFLSAHEKKGLSSVLADAMEQYEGPVHKKAIVKMQWDLTQCLIKRCRIRIQYQTYKGECLERVVIPVDLVFSEYYFYLIAFRVQGKPYAYPAFFRIDRIQSFSILPSVPDDAPYWQFRFSKIAPSLHFMFGGEQTEAMLWCSAGAKEAVLDNFPNHQIVEYAKDGVIFTTNVFIEGFLRWLPTQGTEIKILSPNFLQELLKKRLEAMIGMYLQKG